MMQYHTQAVCLKTKPFREADLLVWFYGKDHGIIRGVVKGAKKPGSKLAGACEPLTINDVHFAKGKGLDTVCHYSRLESNSNLRTSLERLAVGGVCNEILYATGREAEPDSADVFLLFQKVLQELDDLNTSWIKSSLLFHLAMLGHTGYLLDFEMCLHCGQVLDLNTGHPVAFSLMQDGFLCAVCSRLHGAQRKVDVSEATMKLFQNPEDERFYQNALKAHRFLAYYWGHRLEAPPLKSFEFLFQVLSASTAEPLVAGV